MAGKKLICDTNVFYDVAEGRKSHSDIVTSAKDSIYFSPISVMEIAGKLSPDNHAKRKAAAQGILDLKAKALPDVESHLCSVFGYKPKQRLRKIKDAVKAIASSKDMAELAAGVPDYLQQGAQPPKVGSAA